MGVWVCQQDHFRYSPQSNLSSSSSSSTQDGIWYSAALSGGRPASTLAKSNDCFAAAAVAGVAVVKAMVAVVVVAGVGVAVTFVVVVDELLVGAVDLLMPPSEMILFFGGSFGVDYNHHQTS